MAEFLGLAGSKFKVRVSSICRGPPPDCTQLLTGQRFSKGHFGSFIAGTEDWTRLSRREEYLRRGLWGCERSETKTKWGRGENWLFLERTETQRVREWGGKRENCWGGTTERTFHYCWRVKSSFKLGWNWFEWNLPATNLSLLLLVISSWVIFCACVHVRNRATEGTECTPPKEQRMRP
jgi:hypothetical protein